MQKVSMNQLQNAHKYTKNSLGLMIWGLVVLLVLCVVVVIDLIPKCHSMENVSGENATTTTATATCNARRLERQREMGREIEIESETQRQTGPIRDEGKLALECQKARVRNER